MSIVYSIQSQVVSYKAQIAIKMCLFYRLPMVSVDKSWTMFKIMWNRHSNIAKDSATKRSKWRKTLCWRVNEDRKLQLSCLPRYKNIYTIDITTQKNRNPIDIAGLTKEQLSNLWVTRATYQLGWALYLYIKVYIDIFM